MLTDPISDILTRIRNAIMVKHEIVPLPKTQMSESLLRVLKTEGFIQNYITYTHDLNPRFYHCYKKKLSQEFYIVTLKYKGKERKSVISKLERVSKPGLRVYTNGKAVPVVLDHIGIAIISTSIGVIPGYKAKYLGIGGEVLCYIS